jgi:hypothetical protein
MINETKKTISAQPKILFKNRNLPPTFSTTNRINLKKFQKTKNHQKQTKLINYPNTQPTVKKKQKKRNF